ncbi:MAG: HEPN domain-containing protein [bacterium]|nr:HEPN domain-containing protein [bacterium]
MPERSRDWYRQAERDLESARVQLGAGFFEWACFIAQQSAEKAAKAVYQKIGAEAWGHSVLDLLTGLGERMPVEDSLLDEGRRLDRYYIPSRYPNSWVSGFPGRYITEEDARGAIAGAETIIRFCKGVLAG